MAKLVYEDQGVVCEYVLDPGGAVCTIGRNPACEIRVNDPSMSRRHAEVQFNSRLGGFEVRDLGSSNGTYINGRPAASSVLRDGDELVCGEFRLRLTEDGARVPAVSAETMAPQGAAFAAARAALVPPAPSGSDAPPSGRTAIGIKATTGPDEVSGLNQTLSRGNQYRMGTTGAPGESGNASFGASQTGIAGLDTAPPPRISAAETALRAAVERLEAEADMLRAESDRLRADNDRAHTALESVRTQLETARGDAERSRSAAQAVERGVASLRDEVETLRSDRARAQAAEEALHAQLAAAQRTVSDLEIRARAAVDAAQYADLEQRLAAMLSENERLITRINGLGGELNEAADALGERDDQIADLTAQIEAAMRSRHEMAERIASLEAMQSMSATELDELRAELFAASADRDAAQAQLAASAANAEAVAGLTDALDAARAELAATAADRDALAEQVGALVTRIDGLEAAAAELGARAQDAEAAAASTAAQLEAAQSELAEAAQRADALTAAADAAGQGASAALSLEMQAALDDAEAALMGARVELETARAERDEATDRAASASAELEAARAQLQSLSAELEAAQAAADLIDDPGGSSASAEALEARIAALETQLSATEMQLAEAEALLASAERPRWGQSDEPDFAEGDHPEFDEADVAEFDLLTESTFSGAHRAVNTPVPVESSPAVTPATDDRDELIATLRAEREKMVATFEDVRGDLKRLLEVNDQLHAEIERVNKALAGS